MDFEDKLLTIYIYTKERFINDISFNETPESSRVTERIVSRLGFGKYKFPALPGYP